jgi:hypothetical protein
MRSLRKGIAAVALLAALSATGCVQHVHHQRRSAVVLDREHNGGKIVVVQARPAATRHCWKHRAHWHCSR